MNQPIRRLSLVFTVLAAFAQAGCNDATEPPAHLQVIGGDPGRGHSLIRSYGCGVCHTIEGVRGANGRVGPSLDDYATRNMLAGILPNTPPILVSWLMDPVAIEPRTAMPAMGISEAEARHIAAYLYTLGASRAPVYPPDPPPPLQGREALVLPGRAQPPGGGVP